MPEKFLIPDAPPFWTAGKIWTIIAVVVTTLVGVVIWLVMGLQPTPPPTTTTTETSEFVPVETLPTTTIEPETEPVPENSEAEPTETPVTPAEPTILPRALDSDGDELTDVEEALYGTQPSQADSDGDGFLDFAELERGYNPTGPGRVTETKLFTTFTSTTHNLQILYPTSWVPEGKEGQVLITASSDEFFSITNEPKGESTDLQTWYQTVVPTSSATLETIGTRQGIFSPDRRTFYFSDATLPTSVFVVTYHVGTKTETNFTSTFELLLQSLIITP